MQFSKHLTAYLRPNERHVDLGLGLDAVCRLDVAEAGRVLGQHAVDKLDATPPQLLQHAVHLEEGGGEEEKRSVIGHGQVQSWTLAVL